MSRLNDCSSSCIPALVIGLLLSFEGGVLRAYIPRHPIDVDLAPETGTLGHSEHFPLHQAAEQGADQTMVALLAAGAPVDKRDADGQTPLHVAVAHRHAQIAAALLAAGADPEEALASAGAPLEARAAGDTPLLTAARHDRAEAAAALLLAGADPSVRTWVSGGGDAVALAPSPSLRRMLRRAKRRVSYAAQ